MARLPLEGITVLDFTNMLAGPYCTRLLADLGALVLKVEPPAGDHNRARRPVREGHSSFFGHINAGKKSIVLDLKSKDGLGAALALAAQADVVIENWRPGVAKRLGVGYDAVARLRPDTIYCSISGFGQSGPKSMRPAYAPIIHAASGYDLAQMTYQGGTAEKPANSAIFIADVMGGLAGFGAIQTALFDRAVSGRGHYIDVALLDAMLNLLIFELQEEQAPSPAPLRTYQPLRTTDGFVVVAPTSQRNFETLAKVLDHPEWISDPRFVHTKIREEHWDILMRLIEEWTTERTSAACEDALLAAAVPCTRYLRVGEAMADPQVLARGSFSTVTDPAGSYLVPNAPFRFAGFDAPVSPDVPGLGADTASVLAGVGVSTETAQN
ncbi:CoA transferase [Pseudooceanicola nanhaiensis]|uniref:CoA transferase n=1 Tax=Pseudooceanicola nanhaiensis TaxID=375761 RepID=A0A917TBB7_9RHOB|nr:CaiB/BaiF CoA-transferase family protein [Pseudooceanicola nanhaiensis]GGM16028.1 CoA transferase [Pseudooceanicola nanhaiensis]